MSNDNGLQDAAVFLLAVGEKNASEILKHLSPNEVKKLGEAIANTSPSSSARVDAVIAKFTGTAASQRMLVLNSGDILSSVLKLADDNPASVANIIRTWISGMAAKLMIHTEAIRSIRVLNHFMGSIHIAYKALSVLEVSCKTYDSDVHGDFSAYTKTIDRRLRRFADLESDRKALAFKDYVDFRMFRKKSEWLDIQIVSLNMNSPGAWEFLGSINPFETIRQYLNDRHKRELELKREVHALEALKLENQIKANEVVKGMLENVRLSMELSKATGTTSDMLSDHITRNINPRLEIMANAVVPIMVRSIPELNISPPGLLDDADKNVN